jgi:hypothetical protein
MGLEMGLGESLKPQRIQNVLEKGVANTQLFFISSYFI